MRSLHKNEIIEKSWIWNLHISATQQMDLSADVVGNFDLNH